MKLDKELEDKLAKDYASSKSYEEFCLKAMVNHGYKVSMFSKFWFYDKFNSLYKDRSYFNLNWFLVSEPPKNNLETIFKLAIIILNIMFNYLLLFLLLKCFDINFEKDGHIQVFATFTIISIISSILLYSFTGAISGLLEDLQKKILNDSSKQKLN